MVHFPRQMNPVHTTPSNFYKINFNIILYVSINILIVLFLSGFPTKTISKILEQT
jgi:hypothetical protein